MGSIKTRCGVVRATMGFVLTGLIAACSTGPQTPAPVYSGRAIGPGWSAPPRAAYGAQPRRSFEERAERSYAPRPLGGTRAARPLPPLSPPGPAASLGTPPGPMASLGPPPGLSGPPPAPSARITVTRGQSLGLLAHRYHVSERELIEANHLRPPYKIEIGQQLLIPGAAGPMTAEGGPGSPLPGAARVAEREPSVIPLDGLPPKSPPPGAATAPPLPGEQSVAEEARADSGAAPRSGGQELRSGSFPWPVRGRIVGTYGVSANGTKNDGINIAAPLGAPVRAIEGGEVAYAGNELKGYGNLVLIKHAAGWISAYAHCQELLVHKGERVRAGQVIAKVGTTGGVKRPQLHFELRRGERPVDPREFLGPAPSAANGNSGEG